ncbi:MAG: Flp pilus assembly complex ATPase component TadA [Phycisphaerae bacterium]|jgi:type II secretory ATPase GspE/PulE/Tfp pilus assembly ATPase PilB-like protein|nr:Flp pilus assembly complex ATPase component TadA [Phycisphaerae bacterium]
MSIESILRERGLLEPAQLERAMDEHRRTGERVDQIAVRLGFLQSRSILTAVAEQFDLPVIDLDAVDPDPQTLRSLPAKLVFKLRCVPVERLGPGHRTLRVATSDPFHLHALDELRLATGMSVDLVLADDADIAKFIRRHYGVAGDTLDALSADERGSVAEDGSAGFDAGSEDDAEEASVIKLVNDLLVEAIRERATDVHIEPYEQELIIRYRIDGVLSSAGVPPTISRFRNAIVSRLKIMANLNIAEKRRPQDGRISLRHKGVEFDLRVSIIPMLHGEGVVLRVLNKGAVLMGLEELGMPSDILARWDALIARPHGILLVTGPTGSGKSTTLYGSLARIVNDEVKAITVEDPVEYHVPGVNQIQVNSGVGLTFSAGLRAILRHDPDIIMIGEIRDQETASAAVQASLTGHLVFSTLHTNDSAGATTRLLDMGVEPFLVASSVEGIMAQRLLRRLCMHCRKPITPGAADLPTDFPPNGHALEIYEAVGCRECRQTGYRGRVGIYELLTLTERTRELIMQRANASRIAETAMKDGDLCLLRDAAYRSVLSGTTTITEALRATKG